MALAVLLMLLLAGSGCDPCDNPLSPVECEDLCDGPTPHADCAQCRTEPRDPSCPQCQGESPLPGCPPRVDGGVSDGGGVDGGTDAGGGGEGGAGGAAGSGGTGGASGSGGAGGTGGASGSGGAGGTGPATTCSASAPCDDELPACGADGVCRACTGNGACEGRGENTICDARIGEPTRGQCVQCTSNTHCGASAPYCVGARCVECRSHADCTDDAAPQCSAVGVCEPCTADAACTGRAGTERCDTAASSALVGQCVECVAHDDCDNPTPQCGSARSCEACTGNAACADRPGARVCNVQPGSATEGECVECTGAHEALGCGNFACDRSENTCTTVERGTLANCAACAADSECGVGSRCVLQTFGGTDVGTFCFFDRDANDGCAADRPAARPFSLEVAATSVDGAAATYCLPVTTCTSLAHTVVSGGLACTMNTQCGVEGLADGYCAESGTFANTCTYRCSQDYDCPGALGSPSSCAGPFLNEFCQ